MRNRAQPFLKVTLPPGASIVSVDVSGETAKPVLGTDGIRVPLMRPGFRPDGTYSVSFVYLHAGTPFARKGEMQMTLPTMDIPIGFVRWEVFVPDTYSVRAIGGNVIDERTLYQIESKKSGRPQATGRGQTSFRIEGASSAGIVIMPADDAQPGQIVGRVTDTSGVVLPGVTVTLERGAARLTAVTDGKEKFLLTGVPSGSLRLTAQLLGFASQTRSIVFDQKPLQVEFVLTVGQVLETLTVTAETPPPSPEPSQNVVNLQQRAAGVLPIPVDVPRAGTSYQFVKPLVVDQEAVVMLRYKRK